MSSRKRRGQKTVSLLLAFTMVLSTVFSFSETVFADGGSSSIKEFEKAMEFYMYLNGEKPEEGQESQLVDSGDSGKEQTLWLRWVYADGSIPVNAEDTYMELTFPKGITPAYPSTDVANFTKRDGPNDSTIIKVSWKALQGGGAKETFVTFRTPNGTTADGTTYDIPIKVFYKDQESQKFSQQAKYTAVAKNFGWKGSHSASTASKTVTDTRELGSFTCSYSLDSLYSELQHTGFTFTKELTLKETVTVDPNIDVKKEDLKGGTGVTFSDYKYRDGTYLTSFTVNYKATSEDQTKELTYTQPTFTVDNVKVKEGLDESKTISEAMVASGGQGTATAVTGVKDKGNPGKTTFDLSNNWKLSIQYNSSSDEDAEKSRGMVLSHSYYKGHTGNSMASDKGIYANDQIGTYMYGFTNGQSKDMDSYKIAQTFDPSLIYPTKVLSGRYSYYPDSDYTINMYDASGKKIGTIPDVSFTNNKEYRLEEYMGKDGSDNPYAVTQIAKIEWDFGAVPIGFKVYSTSSVYCPNAYFNVKEQEAGEDGNYKDPVVKAGTQFVYSGKSVPAKAEDMYTASYTYKYKVAEKTDKPVVKNKTMKNLSNPGASKAMAGDLLEYTISVTNRSGVTLHAPEIEDRSENQSLYKGALPDGVTGYPTEEAKKYAAVVSSPKDSGIELQYITTKDKNLKGENDKHVFIKLNGQLKPEEKMEIKYILRVNDDVEKDSKLTNKFDAFGYPSGSGYVRLWMDDGYYEGSSSGQSAIPRLDITYGVKNSDGTVHTNLTPTVTGDTIDISYDITNTDYMNGKSGSVHLANFIQLINKNNLDDGYEFVANSGQIQFPDGSVKKVNEGGDTVYGSSYLKFKFDLTDTSISGDKGSIEIAPGKTATLTFKLKAIRDGVSGSQLYEAMNNYYYALFTEAHTDLMYRLRLNSGSFGTYSVLNNDSSNLDRQDTTKSYTSNSGYLYLKRGIEKYGSVYNTVAASTSGLRSDHSQTYLDNSTERAYEARFYNYSEEDLDVQFEKILARLPQFESYVKDSATLTYVDGGLNPTIPLENVTHVKTIDNRRIMQFNADSKTVVPDNPKHNAPAISGSPSGKYYVSLKFKTEITGGDLENILKELAGTGNLKSFTDSAGFASAFYVKGEGKVRKGANYWLTEMNDKEEDWDNSTATESFYTGNYITSYSYLGNLTVPGISIKPYQVLKEDDSEEGFYSISEGITPGIDAGFQVAVGNNSSREIVDPKIVVVMPLGTTFKGFLNDDQPSEIKNIQKGVVDSREVVTFDTNMSLRSGEEVFKFQIKADTKKALGVHQAEAYLVPMNTFEVFGQVYTAVGGSKVTKNFNATTGLKDAATNKDFDMVYSNCSVPIYGLFAFASDITVEEKADNKASSGGSITLPRDNNKFKYTLNFTNESRDKTYEKYVLINRLPGKNDIYNVNPEKRGSTADVAMTSDPVITLNGTTLTPGTDYKIYYSKDARNTVYTNAKEYAYDTAQGDLSADWSDTTSRAEATAFRVLFEKKIAPKSEMKITYNAEFEGAASLPRTGVLANNSFAFGLNAEGSSRLDFAEPAEVGVNFENKYISQVDGKIFVDVNNDGKYTGGTDALYKGPIEVFLHSVNASGKTQVASMKINDATKFGTGAYQFTGLKDNEKYEVSFDVPSDYELSSQYSAATSDNALVANNFKMEEGKAVGGFATPKGADSKFYVNGALKATAGTIDGQIFIDNDEDGIYNAAKGDELFKEKVNVSLVDQDGTTVKTVDTDAATGKYEFASVLLGKYTVKFNAPNKYKRTAKSTDFTGTTKLATGILSLSAVNDHITANAGLITQKAPKNPTKAVTSVKGKDGAAVKIGDVIEYTISYFNHNPDAANVTITDKLDSGVEFVEASHGGKNNNGTVTWNLADVAAETTGTVTLKVKVLNTADAKVLNDATVKVGADNAVKSNQVNNPVQVDVNYKWVSKDNPSDVTPPGADTVNKNSAYNAKTQTASKSDDYVFRGWYTDEDCTAANAYVDGTVLKDNTTLYGSWEKSGEKQAPEKVISSVKGKDGTAVKIGDVIEYTISYYNHKPSAATVVVTDKLDNGVEFVEADHGGAFNDGTVTWTMNNVPKQTSGTVTVKVKVLKTAGAKVYNQASVKIGNDNAANTNKVENPVKIDVNYKWISTDNPSDVTPPAGVTIDKNSAYKATAQTASKNDDYMFRGWYTDKDCSIANEYADGTVLKDNTTLYGSWEKSGEKQAPQKAVTGVKGKDGAAVKIGDIVEYTISYYNHKPGAATILITDKLDDGVEFVDASNGGQHENGTVIWTMNNVPKQTSGTVTVKVKVLNTAGAKVYNQASVKVGNDNAANTNKVENPVKIDVSYKWASKDNPSDVTPPETDTVNKNSGYTAKTQAESKSDDYVFRGWYTKEDCAPENAYADGTVLKDNTTLYGSWEKSGEKQAPEKIVTGTNGKDDSAVKIGDIVEYTIGYYNHKPAAATVLITDQLDSGVEFVEASNGGQHNNGTVTWTINNVPKQTSGTVTVKVKVLNTAGSEVKNKAQVKIGNDNGVDTNEVKNPVKVSVKYKWVGDILPTDVTPPLDGEADVIAKGTAYDAHKQDPTNERSGKKELLFAGWYTDEGLKNKFVDGTKIEEDTILYGMWEEGEETTGPIKEGYPVYVDYEWVSDDNPADVKPPSRDTSESGKAFTATKQEMTNDGKYKWTFEGWYTDKECETLFEDATIIKQDMTLYGRWIKEDIDKETVPSKNDPKDNTKPGKNGNGTKTGDDSNVGLYIGLAALAALGIIGTALPVLRRRYRSDK